MFRPMRTHIGSCRQCGSALIPRVACESLTLAMFPARTSSRVDGRIEFIGLASHNLGSQWIFRCEMF
jgi:hypothetical protein